jgi:hypothetical protein
MLGLKLAGVGRYVAPLSVKGATPDIALNFNRKAPNVAPWRQVVRIRNAGHA